MTRGDLINELPTDNSSATPSELAVLDKIFKKKNNGKVSKEKNDKDEKKCRNIYIVTIIGGIIAGLLSLPFINKIIKSFSDSMSVTIITHFVLFCLLFFMTNNLL